jgi:tetratricopeptide (TPR) repeat protein
MEADMARHNEWPRRAIVVAAVLGGAALVGCGAGGYPELAAPDYLRSGSPRAVAADLFKKASELEPDRTGPLDIAGRGWLKYGYDDEADKLLARVLSMAPDDGYKLADIAAAYIEAHREDVGLRYWTAAKAVAASKPRAWIPLAAAWARVGNVARAEEFFERALTLKAGLGMSNARKQREMGLAWLDAGDKDRAESCLARALTLGPEDGYQMIDIGAAWLSAGEHDKGEALLKKGFTLAVSSDPIRANRDVAAAYVAVGDLATAERFAKGAIAADPGEDDTYLVLGRAFLKAGKVPEAEDMLGKALRAGSDDWELLGLVGVEWLSLEPAGRGAARPAPAAPEAEPSPGRRPSARPAGAPTLRR